MTVRHLNSLALSLAAIAETTARGIEKDACVTALLLLGSYPTLDRDAPAKDRDAEGHALNGAIKQMLAHITAEGAEEVTRLRPAADYMAEALRAAFPRADKLSRLTDPLTPDGELKPAEWSLLGAATRLHTEEALGPLYVAVSSDPHLFSNINDPQALFAETCDLENGIRIRGQHDPINQWLCAMRDTRGQVHDVLDVATGMVNAQAYFIPAAIFAKKAVLPQTSAACLALQAARVHDVCEAVFAEDEKLFRGHLRGAHVRLIVGQSLGLGACDCLTQNAWAKRAGERDRSFGTQLPEILATALTGTMFTFTDPEMAGVLKRMHAQGHDVCGHTDENKPLPLHDLVIMGMPMAVKAVLDSGADPHATLNGQTAKDMIREGGRESQALRAIISAAEARRATAAVAIANEARAMAMP